MFECKTEFKSSICEHGKSCCSLNARHVARCPITLSSTCNLMPRREEGSASLPPGVIYDWGHVNKNIKTIWALVGEIPVRYVHHARQAWCRESPALWYYAPYGCPVAPLLNRICSCCLGFFGGSVGVALLTQGDICVNVCTCSPRGWTILKSWPQQEPRVLKSYANTHPHLWILWKGLKVGLILSYVGHLPF